MYNLLGHNQSLKNLICLLKAYSQENINNNKDLKLSYINFLKNIQPKVWKPTLEESQNILVHDRSKVISLVENFLQDDSILTDFNTDSKIVLADSEEQSKKALSLLTKAKKELKDIDPDFYEMFKVIINSIFYAKSTMFGGGSASTAIGVIWCGPRKKWNHLDFIEFMVHEFSHNFLFIDELLHGHYNSIKLMSNPENFAYSTILNKNRPLDKVLHSYVVAFEVYQFRKKVSYPIDRINIHPNNDRLIQNIMETAKSVKKIKNLREIVTPRFIWILEKIEQIVLDEMKNKELKNVVYA